MNAPAASILVVDDEPDLRTLYELTLLREGYRVETASSVQEARQQLKDHRFDAVITDMRLPDGFGMELLLDLRNQQRRERCVVMTAYGSAENAVEALRSGAFDYLTKPVDLKQFRSVVASAVQGTGGVPAPRSSRSPARPGSTTEPTGTGSALDRLIGESEAICNVKQRIAKVARSMAPVLIHGESGTGKELVAQALHASSQRSEGPLIAVNCGAIPENLLEAEFFGARKGSYTGAGQDRDGYFQAARGGTLFLDEIGDMPSELQTRLLRVLSDGHFHRVGGQQPIKANVRVIAATHQNLDERVKQGLFREDLFHRLNVIRLRLPALKERSEDIPLLTRHFLQKSAQELGVETKRMSDATLKYLSGLEFPGNVRQIENLCHWLTVMAPGQTIEVTDLPSELREQSAQETPLDWLDGLAAEADRLISVTPGDVFERLIGDFERTLIRRALAATGGRRVDAAQLLGIGRNTITRKIQELGLEDAKPAESQDRR